MPPQHTPDHDTGVYCIENLITGADYIGGTTASFQKRWNMHRHLLRKGYHVNEVLQRDWNRYGESAFVFHIVERISDPDEVWRRETYWISARMRYCTADENYNEHTTARHSRLKANGHAPTEEH